MTGFPSSRAAGLVLGLCLAGCAARPPVDTHPVKSGNPVRDAIEADLFRFKSAHAQKAAVLAGMGGRVIPVSDASFLEKLPHAEESTVIVPPEMLARWKAEFGQSADTVYVMAEDGNDMLLFFDKAARLVDYIHM